MKNNYLFFDGSALLSDIKMMRKRERWLTDRKLKLSRLVYCFAQKNFTQFHSGHYRRAVFYFVDGDQRLGTFVDIPDATTAGAVEDLRIERCGKRIGNDEQVTEWLRDNKAPDYVTERLHRSEKAVDTQICCDAMQLAALGKLDRLFLYTNDFDFAPLTRTLRQFGANVNLMRLHPALTIHKELAPEFDALHVLNSSDFDECFGGRPEDKPKAEEGG